jgi:hypothetical protein
MGQESASDLRTEHSLQDLGIECLCRWDVLVFLHRHHASLVSAEDIARLLGYPTGEVVTALNGLESLDLVRRSRVDQGRRLYQFSAPADPSRGDSLDRLITLADSRAGRLLLARKLRRGNPPNRNTGPSRLRGEGATRG